ncbi:brain and acute leukemia cytoplasmic protein isoform X2 [Protopterus annectens]|uniref:brain and acute leukemia cytoplasmic protein isoform X2 n=1 Tax=Protopterus annectens TaxID=7888 RepID=UPI001CFBFDA9|nr:brain and acute leukemia cytoplasmic protein isoform X2 [Protopterus annectens]
MGCGGSRADAIEPRYYESWTRETESTWLTNTDAENPGTVLSNGCTESSIEANGKEKGALHSARSGLLEEGRPFQNCVTGSSKGSEKANAEKKTTNCGTQCGKPTVHASGSTAQKKGIFRTAETKWDSKRMSTKEVSINVAKNIRQIDSDGRIIENCAN